MGTTSVINEIAEERFRQTEVEGWSLDHDDLHDQGEIAKAAAAYCTNNWLLWPWDLDWWKPKDDRSNLLRSAALIVAEIERLDRLADQGPVDQEES